MRIIQWPHQKVARKIAIFLISTIISWWVCILSTLQFALYCCTRNVCIWINLQIIQLAFSTSVQSEWLKWYISNWNFSISKYVYKWRAKVWTLKTGFHMCRMYTSIVNAHAQCETHFFFLFTNRSNQVFIGLSNNKKAYSIGPRSFIALLIECKLINCFGFFFYIKRNKMIPETSPNVQLLKITIL